MTDRAPWIAEAIPRMLVPMGYRNETEQLREKVRQLEGQLGSLKGRRLAGREATFASRVRRQTVMISLLAAGMSAMGMCCLWPTIDITLENREVPVAEVLSADMPTRTVRFRAALDVREGWGAFESDSFVPVVGHPELLVHCGWDCAPRLRRRIRIGANEGPTSIGGLVYTVAQNGQLIDRNEDVAYLSSSPDANDDLLSYAEDHSLPVTSLRVVNATSEEDPSYALWVLNAMVLLAGLFLFGALLVYRRGSRADIPLATIADLSVREPYLPPVLALVTCRLYEVIWLAQTTAQLRRITGRPDLVPAVDVLMYLGTFGLWGYWAMYRNAEAVDESMSDAGTPRSDRTTVLALTLASFLCGLLHWGVLYKVQESINRLVTERVVEE